MKKFFLLIFVTFCSLIFYQIILGKNGVIEGYRIKKEKERLVEFIKVLNNKIKENKDYIKFLKTDSHALKSFAEELGYYEDENIIIRIIDNIDNKKVLESNKNDIDKSIDEIINNEVLNQKISKLRLWLSIFFYFFFGFFIFIILFGVKKNEE